MISKHYGKTIPMFFLSKICFVTTEGVSLKGIGEAADNLGIKTIAGNIKITKLSDSPLPCILHWNQNHFVVLYKVKKGKIFYVADPAKGLVKYNIEDFKKHWISTHSSGEEKGIAMFLEPTPAFYERQIDEQPIEERSFRFLFGYIRQYRRYFGQIVLGLLVGSLLQLILPFLTQAIVDVGIKKQNIGFMTDLSKDNQESFCKAKRKGVIDKLKRYIDVKYKVIQ